MRSSDNPGFVTFDYTVADGADILPHRDAFQCADADQGVWRLPATLRFHGERGAAESLGTRQIRAAWAASNTLIAPSLGRNLSSCPADTGACAARSTVPLVQPQTVFEDRRTQLDLRVSRRFKFGSRYSFDASLDVYNVTNSSSVISLSETFGPTWQQPTAILDARMFQINARFTF